MAKSDKLEDYRRRIDKINMKLCRLLNQRAGIALKIGNIKSVLGQKIYSPKRERTILEAVSKQNKGPLSKSSLQRIFKAIMRETRTLEKSSKSGS
jgi:chorismate mutase-like protein